MKKFLTLALLVALTPAVSLRAESNDSAQESAETRKSCCNTCKKDKCCCKQSCNSCNSCNSCHKSVTMDADTKGCNCGKPKPKA